MAESVDRTPAKQSPAKMRHFQTFKEAYHENWPFVTVDTWVNSDVCNTVVI